MKCASNLVSKKRTFHRNLIANYVANYDFAVLYELICVGVIAASFNQDILG